MTSALLAPPRRPSADKPSVLTLLDGGSPRKPREEEQVQDHTIPLTGGRSILIRPCWEGEAVQFAILSTHGNIIEAANLDTAQLPALIAALTEAGKRADRDLMGALKRREVELAERHRAALARNPWLNGKEA